MFHITQKKILDTLRVPLSPMGELYFLDSSFLKARQHFEKSSSINPGDHLSLYYLGVCHFENEDYINAAKYFKRSIKINPDHPKSHYHLAVVYNILGIFLGSVVLN